MRLPRFQYSLRTLLIVVTLLAIPCGYVGWQAKIVRDRKTMRVRIAGRGGYSTEPDSFPITYMKLGPDFRVSWIRQRLGDFPVAYIYYGSDSPADVPEIQECFPEAIVKPLPPDNR